MADSAARLAAVRAVLAGRGDARRTTDVAYLVYAAVLVAGIVVVPLVRAVVGALSGPELLALLAAPTAGRWVGLVAVVLLPGAVLVGRVRGPAVVRPFYAVTVVGSDLPRRATLRRPVVVGGALLTTAVVVPSAVLAWVLHDSAGAPAAAAGAFVLGSAALGALAALAWLAGQRLGPRSAAALAGSLAVVVGLAALVRPPGPAGALAVLWPTATSPSWALPAATAGTVLVLVAARAAVPRLLDGLHGPDLLAQARRWERARTASAAGDLAGAVATFRAPPRTGRAWRAVRGRSPLVRFLVRDAIGAARAPARCATGTVALLLSGWSVASGLDAPAPVGVAVAAAGAVLGYLGLGVVSDGLRHAVEAAAAPALYRHGTAELCALHAALPTACALVLPGLGAAVATALDGRTPTVWATTAAVSCVLVLLRLRDSAKGTLPSALLAPVASPAGDLSVVGVLVWHADALLLSALVGAAAAGARHPLSAALVLGCSGLVVLLSTRRRLRRV